MKIETIYTERFLMRKVEKSDCEAIFDLLNNPEIIENLNMPIHKHIGDTEEMLEEYLEEYEKGNKYPYAIIEKHTNCFVGVFLIKLDIYDEDCFEFTIYLKKDFWGKGIYTEILPYMIEIVFEGIKVGNFRGFVMERNIASGKVLEKYRFRLEKVFQVPGIEGNIKSYLLTNEEYRNRK